MLYDYTETTPADIARVTDDAIIAANTLIDEIASITGPNTVENSLLPLNEAAAIILEAYGRGAFMARVHPDADVRIAATDEEEKLNLWGVEVVFRADAAIVW